MSGEPKTLYRSQKNRMLGGVCAGLGDYLDLDPTVMRLIFVLLFFVTGGTMVLAYLILLLIVPNEPIQSA